MNEPLLEVAGLRKYFPVRGGFLRRPVGEIKAVDGVDLTVNRGETVALVGESGCGKSTTGRTIVRLEEPTAGEVVFHHPERGPLHLESANSRTLRAVRPHLQMIFQDPFASLDSRMTVSSIIAEPLVINKTATGQRLKDRVAELLSLVGLRPEHANRYPHAFSGGQRQRIGIARAIALNPDLIVCDEAVSALDLSVQAQILNLLEELQRRLGIAYLFISHDLSAVDHIADRVVVMYVGQIVESGPVEQLYNAPKHPYTEALLAAVPQPDPRVRTRPKILTGDVPSPANPPSGCTFHPRCPYAQPICAAETPPLLQVGEGRASACHFADTLPLTGAVAAMSPPAGL
ncbi:peptide/nickel transport system ATP-binding protein [Kribbella pratensis]|uniref:Peptide/nickel transport system ATP-binding protein n=1 Tax=Kribbella pratensis TaxID=2512112 RepID=A0ABY2F880_9ACTN|nr:oligopeptide/dipeptide ABC transporter ATP-binding protein [Kribbella pratensis]TDW84425.1 peptide/nickel transport system ATP-binding protein [Kribbella pratensis]